MGVVDIDITMAWIYRFSVFFTTKTMRIMKIHHWTSCGKNTTPSTELPRDFCAGIGPLQLGVVLVFIIFCIKFI